MAIPISDVDARFERAIDRWFRDRLRLEPTLASFVGVHEHDGRLPAASRESMEERTDFWRAVVAENVEARLKQDKAGAIKAILVAQIDTASGVVNDIAAIRKAIDAARHDALFMVDAVASLACVPFEMDGWGVDVAVAASQKGLMTPTGLGFVAASDRARDIRETRTSFAEMLKACAGTVILWITPCHSRVRTT